MKTFNELLERAADELRGYPEPTHTDFVKATAKAMHDVRFEDLLDLARENTLFFMLKPADPDCNTAWECVWDNVFNEIVERLEKK